MHLHNVKAMALDKEMSHLYLMDRYAQNELRIVIMRTCNLTLVNSVSIHFENIFQDAFSLISLDHDGNALIKIGNCVKITSQTLLKSAQKLNFEELNDFSPQISASTFKILFEKKSRTCFLTDGRKGSPSTSIFDRQMNCFTPYGIEAHPQCTFGFIIDELNGELLLTNLKTYTVQVLK